MAVKDERPPLWAVVAATLVTAAILWFGVNLAFDPTFLPHLQTSAQIGIELSIGELILGVLGGAAALWAAATYAGSRRNRRAGAAGDAASEATTAELDAFRSDDPDAMLVEIYRRVRSIERRLDEADL